MNTEGTTSLMDNLVSWLSGIVDFFYGNIILYVFIFAALFYTIVIRGSQFKYVFHSGSLLFAKHHGGGTSGFSSYAISTASRVGTGNMAGIMIAVSTGGPGALFWMWVMALFSSSLAFAESTLAQFYKEKNSLGHYVGGASFYIKSKLKMPVLAVIFAIIMIVTYTTFNGVQANTISGALSIYNVNSQLTGIILTIIVAVILFTPGRQAIIKACTYIVPVMAIPFILLGIIAVIMNIGMVPAMFKTIFMQAFQPDAIYGGAIGTTITIGLRRGLFSNEAGMGGAPHAAAAAHTSHPARQGFIQMFSVFTDTLIICSISGFILLLSPEAMNVAVPNSSVGGINIMQIAMQEHFGEFGKTFVTLCVVLFSFSSILGNFFYIQTGVSAVKDNAVSYYIVASLTLILVLTGSIVDLKLIWGMGDFLMGIMALLNIAVVIMLYKPVSYLLKNYLTQWNNEKIPVYIKGDIPEIEDNAVTQWDKKEESI